MVAELPLIQQLIPWRAPRPGEQYRFHFDMTKCIGCKCCVVACNEQNGNPAAINWRRVGEVEGGVYPNVERWHLSMGCNHCLEPSCMTGCPVNAYTKDPVTGIVDHDADTCIGCQYCTWNCSYGVPQFNAERGVVGKCDMCHSRLNDGMAPACANACPEQAIRIELVNTAEWRANLAAANAPGMPSASDSLSTTRITLPESGIPLERVDRERSRPEHPHFSLVFVLVMTQFAIGTVAALVARQISGAVMPAWAAILPLLVAGVALAAAPAHLGRPIHAYRAIRNWRRSWLSREVLALGLFAKVTAAYAAIMFFEVAGAVAMGCAATLLGAMGVMSSARIYMVPARPSWATPHTMADFFLTAAVLGTPVLAPAAAATAMLAQLAMQVARHRALAASEMPERRASAEFLGRELRVQFLARLGLLAAALMALPFNPFVSLALAAAGELLGRWIFFASAVPKTVASTYLTPGGRS